MKAVSLTTVVCFSMWTILHINRGERVHMLMLNIRPNLSCHNENVLIKTKIHALKAYIVSESCD